jgi:integrase
VEGTENPRRAAADAVNSERPSAEAVALYAQYLVQVKQATLATVEGAMAAIADKLVWAREQDPTYQPTSGALLQRTRAVLTDQAPAARQKKEVTWKQLSEIAALTRISEDAADRRDSCMFMLAYHTLLRGSEVARMDRGDISFSQECINGKVVEIMRVHVNKLSKNDKERLGHERLVGIKAGSENCVVGMMKAYLKESGRGHGDDAPLFRSVRKDARLSVDSPRGRLKFWLGVIGVKEDELCEYGFHSVRAGGATDAARAGVSEAKIKQHGNWKSDAVRVYIRQDTGDRLAVAAALGK